MKYNLYEENKYIECYDDGYIGDDKEKNSFDHIGIVYKFCIVCGLGCILQANAYSVLHILVVMDDATYLYYGT